MGGGGEGAWERESYCRVMSVASSIQRLDEGVQFFLVGIMLIMLMNQYLLEAPARQAPNPPCKLGILLRICALNCMELAMNNSRADIIDTVQLLFRWRIFSKEIACPVYEIVSGILFTHTKKSLKGRDPKQNARGEVWLTKAKVKVK